MTSKVKELKDLRDIIKSSKPEVYTRIVGYYRALSNWNVGKTQEYKDRVEYDVKERIDTKEEEVTYVFVKTVCPLCAPVKAYLNSNSGKAGIINLDDDDSFIDRFNLMATPTLVVVQGENIVDKIVGPERILTYLKNRVD